MKCGGSDVISELFIAYRIKCFRYQKTSEVVAGTADTVKSKWNDMRNSSLFKSFESKLGTAYTSVSSFTFMSAYTVNQKKGGGSSLRW